MSFRRPRKIAGGNNVIGFEVLNDAQKHGDKSVEGTRRLALRCRKVGNGVICAVQYRVRIQENESVFILSSYADFLFHHTRHVSDVSRVACSKCATMSVTWPSST